MTPLRARLSFDRIGSVAVPWHAVLGYAAFTFAVFVVCLLYGLPHELIARRAIHEATRELPIRVSFETVSFAFPNGYFLEGVRIADETDPARSVQLDELAVSTPLLGILLGRVDSADFEGTLYGGSFDGSARSSPGAVSTRLNVEGLSLAPLSRRLLPPPGSVAGTASLELEISGDGRRTQTSEGAIALRATNVRLEGIVAQGFTVPDLRFPEVRLDATLDAGRLKVGAFEAAGDELRVGATGDVLLRDPVTRSVLNLQIEIDVDEAARPGLRVATSLLPPRKAGKKGWALRGSVASPSLR